jgi:hypothetical protein
VFEKDVDAVLAAHDPPAARLRARQPEQRLGTLVLHRVSRQLPLKPHRLSRVENREPHVPAGRWEPAPAQKTAHELSTCSSSTIAISAARRYQWAFGLTLTVPQGHTSTPSIVFGEQPRAASWRRKSETTTTGSPTS